MKKNNIIGMASDHAGFAMKESVKKFLLKNGYAVNDFGTNSEESVDYPDYIHPLASEINKGEIEHGIILCGSGNGVSMTANKYPNVRAALCWSEIIAQFARKHNDANVLSLPARFISEDEAEKIVCTFLKTDFEGGRHKERIDKINKILL